MADRRTTTRTHHGTRTRRTKQRLLGVEPLEVRALLAAFPTPLEAVDPVGSLIYTGSAFETQGVVGPSEDFESGELTPQWSASSSQDGGRIRVTGDAGTAGGTNALLMEYSQSANFVDVAQDIDGAGWTRNANNDIANAQSRPHVTIEGTGDGTFDYYRFTANAGDLGIFDIDATVELDSYLRLYNSSGTVIAQNDDSSTSNGGGGSQTGLDSFLQFSFPAAGVYVIEVGSCCVSPVFSNDSYTLHVSLDDHALEGGPDPVLEVEPNHPPDNLNEAIWTVDLEGVSGALLRFSHANFGDDLDFFAGDFEGSAMADGVAISDDGVRWHPIFTPFGGFGGWEEQVVDLSGEAAAAGMELGPDFQIKFQQYGEDGSSRGWDDISILVPGDETDSFEIAIEPGQLLTLDVTPTIGSLQPHVDVYAVSGDVEELLGTATAAGPGGSAVLQTLPTGPGEQTYRIDVRSAAGVGTYQVRLLLNAALEEEARGGGDNSTIETAQDLEPSFMDIVPGNGAVSVGRAAVLGQLEDGPAGRDDFYALHLLAGDIVTAGLATLEGNAAEIMLLDAEGQSIATGSGGTATNLDRTIPGFAAPATGEYFLRVTGEQNAAYSLLVTRNADLELESNNTFETVQVLEGPLTGRGRWVAGAWNAGDDFPPIAEVEPNHGGTLAGFDHGQNIDEAGWTRLEGDNIAESETRPHATILGTGNNTFDYYRFTVASAGDVGTFDIDDTSGIDSYLRLYDSSGIQLAGNDDSDLTNGAAGSETRLDSFIEFTFPAAGEYVIEVGSCCISPVPPGSYTLHVSLDNHPLTYDIRPIQEVEPNELPPPDLIEVAQSVDEQWSLARDENIFGSTGFPHISVTATGDGTFDYYSFSVERENSFGILDIDFENFNTHLFLFDSEGNLLAENNDDGEDPGSGSSLASAIRHTFSPGTYIVGVGRFFSFAENGAISGTPPQPGDSYTLHISVRGASGISPRDLYAVELDAGARVLLETITPSVLPGAHANELNLGLQIYDSESNLIASDEDSAADGRNAAIALDVPTSGTYYVEVTGDPTSHGEYVLSIREERLEGDHNGDGRVDQIDLDLALMHWGKPADRLPPEWVNVPPSGFVDQEELDAVLVNWGHTSEPMVVASPRPLPDAVVQAEAVCVGDVPPAEQIRMDNAADLMPETARSTKSRRFGLAEVAVAAERLSQATLETGATRLSPASSRAGRLGGDQEVVSPRAAALPGASPNDVVMELLFGRPERLI